MATGETNGNIRSTVPTPSSKSNLCVRLWSTLNYTLVVGAYNLFETAIGCLGFESDRNDSLVAVDRTGRVVWFSLVDDNQDVGFNPFGFLGREINVKDQLELKSHLGDFDFASAIYQLSDDGHTLLCHSLNAESFILLRFSDKKEVACLSYPTLSASDSPLLSPNGESLLMRNASIDTGLGPLEELHNHFVRVVPSLCFEAESDFVYLKGDSATWGLKGEYLLAWNSCTETSTLSVYRTDNISSRLPVAEICLGCGFVDRSVLMLDKSGSEKKLKVLICEISQSEQWRAFIWDVTNKTVTSEVSLMMPYSIPTRRARNNKLWEEPGGRSEARLFEDRVRLLEAAVRPLFCVSSDASWIGVYSCKQRSCTIVSMRTGVAEWQFIVQKKKLQNHAAQHGTATFDPSGRNMVVRCPTTIVACPVSRQSAPFPVALSISTSQREGMKSAESAMTAFFGDLPSEALVDKIATRTLSGFEINKNIAQRILGEIIDASVTVDGGMTAALASGRRGFSVVVNQDNPDENIHLELMHKRFFPRWLFVRHSLDSRDNETVVAISPGPVPIAAFCDVWRQSSKSVQLGMTKCHRVSQSDDQRHLILLDDAAVAIFDLVSQKTVKQIKYKLEFGKILKLVQQNSTKWHRCKLDHGSIDTERRISDDGKAVLLAWDTKNRRSIVVSPSTHQNQCEDLISQAETCLSDFCLLSQNGSWTAFIDVEELAMGNITVGVFNEQGIISSIQSTCLCAL